MGILKSKNKLPAFRGRAYSGACGNFYRGMRAGFSGGYPRNQARAAVREAVLRSAVECYTLEGAYPESLEYLEKHYGLTVNKKEYIVTYEVFADNQLPTVQVLVRGEE